MWGYADGFLRESRHLMSPLRESVAADVFQADVERMVPLKFFEDGEIGLGLAVGAERFLATVGDEVILQSSPVGDGLVKRFLDPEERDVGDAFEESDHAFDGETVVAVDQEFDVGERRVDGVDDLDIALEAGFGRHPLIAASDFDFELAVPIVVIPATVFEDFVDAGGIISGVEIVEVNHARVDMGEMRLCGAGHCPDRLIENYASEVMEGNVDRIVLFGADASGWVDQLGNGFSLDEFEKLFGLARLPLGLAPTGRALVGVEGTDSQPGGAMTVDAFAGIAADLARPGDANRAKFDPVDAVPGESRVGGAGKPRSRCRSGSDGRVTQECAAVHGALDHRAAHLVLDALTESM